MSFWIHENFSLLIYEKYTVEWNHNLNSLFIMHNEW